VFIYSYKQGPEVIHGTLLPPSLHEVMFKNAWHWQDVYHKMVDHTREEATVRILELVCQPNSDYMHFH
jgi:hypothetical protein